MKIIDILNLIAKGGLEEGTEVRIGGINYFYRSDKLENGNGYPLFTASYLPKSALLVEVEIIGKDTGRIKEINVEQFTEYNDADRSRMLFDKLNEVIRELNRRGE